MLRNFYSFYSIFWINGSWICYGKINKRFCFSVNSRVISLYKFWASYCEINFAVVVIVAVPYNTRISYCKVNKRFIFSANTRIISFNKLWISYSEVNVVITIWINNSRISYCKVYKWFSISVNLGVVSFNKLRVSYSEVNIIIIHFVFSIWRSSHV